MKLQLKALAGKTMKDVSIHIENRLPSYVNRPCDFYGDIHVKKEDDHYILHITMQGDVFINCERCLGEFEYHQVLETSLAIACSEEAAKRLMSRMEVEVSANASIDLVDVVTDELHLSLPKQHPDTSACDEEVSRFIGD